MSQLRTLTLDRNPLNDADLCEQTFAGLDKSLESLSLNSAGLILWSKNLMSALNQLQSLRGLKLNGNSGVVKSLESALELTKLNSLELQNSNLDELPQFLCQLNSLTDLDVSSNRIRSVQSSCGLIQIATSSRLKHLNLNNNPLECDCRLRDLKIWLTGTYERDLLELIKWECAKPERLKGKMLVNIPIRDLSCPKTTLPDPTIVVIQPAEETKPTSRSSTTTIQTQTTHQSLLNSTFIPRMISTQPSQSTTIIISWLVVAIGLGILIVLTLILITLYLVCIRSRERADKEGYVKEYLFGSQLKESSPPFSLSSSSSTTTAGSLYTKSSTLDLVDIFGSEYFSGILPAEPVQHVYDKPLNSVLSSRTNQRRFERAPAGHHLDSHVYHEIGGGSEPPPISDEIFYVRKNLSCYINNDNYLIQPEQTCQIASTAAAAQQQQQQLQQYNSLRFGNNNSSFGFVKMNSFNEGLIV